MAKRELPSVGWYIRVSRGISKEYIPEELRTQENYWSQPWVTRRLRSKKNYGYNVDIALHGHIIFSGRAHYWNGFSLVFRYPNQDDDYYHALVLKSRDAGTWGWTPFYPYMKEVFIENLSKMNGVEIQDFEYMMREAMMEWLHRRFGNKDWVKLIEHSEIPDVEEFEAEMIMERLRG